MQNQGVEWTVQKIADYLGATIHLSEKAQLETHISQVSDLKQADENSLSFVSRPEFVEEAKSSKAAAILTKEPFESESILLLHDDPYTSMAKAAQIFYRREHDIVGVSERAVIHPSARLGKDVRVGDFAFVGRNVEIGDGCVIYPFAYVGSEVVLGSDVILYPHVSIMDKCSIGDRCIVHPGAVLGADGFGFAPSQNGIEKIPQVGDVQIGKDCEIGSLSNIDRGAYSSTRLGEQCKLDSLVQVGHGAEVGDMSMLCGQAAIGGSVVTGKRLIMGGASSVGPGVKLADHVVLAGRSCVFQSIPQGGRYGGAPARELFTWKKEDASLKRLPDLLKRVKKLEKEIAALVG